tara:strand:+ start:1143 stop:2045 length:903 start_codon:yes stop_codon:yes gene_type:complete
MFRTLVSCVLLFVVSNASAFSDEQVPAVLIRLPASVTSVFVAEIETANMHRFVRSEDVAEHSGSYYMSIGQAGAGKERSGDKRTPLGIYFVTEQLDTSRLHEKYGATAFPLDYPNAWDQRARRSGDGIWVHGVDPQGGQRPERDTDGCIALRNNDLVSLADEFTDNVTPVIVVRAMRFTSAAENDALRRDLEESVARWAQSQAQGDLHAFLSSYDTAFQRWGLNHSEWLSLLTAGAEGRTIETVDVSELLLLRYPEEDNLFLSRFRLKTVADGTQVESMKRLYWRRDDQGALKIIAENEG